MAEYRTSGIVNPDLADQTPKSEGAPRLKKTQTEGNGESTGEKELVSETERKKREAQQAEKLEEERQAQQKLLQAFYAEKARIDMSPEKIRETMEMLAERSIEQLMSREGSSFKIEWKSELHQVSLAISMEAYDKFQQDGFKPLLGSGS
ncbi:hypothetical protein [Saccharibacillus alkalitolerans]|nr:hypothetical protein [Saccharibacillus alkalitolerans]